MLTYTENTGLLHEYNNDTRERFETVANGLETALGNDLAFEEVNSCWALRGTYKGTSFVVKIQAHKKNNVFYFTNGPEFSCNTTKRPELIRKQFDKELAHVLPINAKIKANKEKQEKYEGDKNDLEQEFIDEFPQTIFASQTGIYGSGCINTIQVNNKKVVRLELHYIKPETAKKILEIIEKEEK